MHQARSEVSFHLLQPVVLLKDLWFSMLCKIVIKQNIESQSNNVKGLFTKHPWLFVLGPALLLTICQ